MNSLCHMLPLRPPATTATTSVSTGRNGQTLRGLRVGILLAVVAILNLVDLAYTLFAQRIGMLEEANPLARSVLSHGLEPSLISYKLLLVLAGSAILWRLRRNNWTVPACWVLITAYSGLIIMWYFWVQEATAALQITLSCQ